MSDSPTGVGVIGLGFQGRSHLELLRHVPARLVAVADIDAECLMGDSQGARTLSDSVVWSEVQSARRYSSAEALLQDRDVALVIVATPTPEHARIAVDALVAGKAVAVEKPLAMSEAEVVRMMEAARSCGRALIPLYPLRHSPAYEMVRELVKTRSLGDLTYLSTYRACGLPTWSTGGWIVDPDRGGGVARDMLVHDVDVVTWMLGSPESVQASSQDGLGREEVSAQLRFEGFDAYLQARWKPDSNTPLTASLQVHGTGGSLILEAGEDEPTERLAFVSRESGPRALDPGIGDAYLRQLRTACAAVPKSPDAVWERTLASFRLSMRVSDAILKSIATGASVAVAR